MTRIRELFQLCINIDSPDIFMLYYYQLKEELKKHPFIEQYVMNECAGTITYIIRKYIKIWRDNNEI